MKCSVFFRLKCFMNGRMSVGFSIVFVLCSLILRPSSRDAATARTFDVPIPFIILRFSIISFSDEVSMTFITCAESFSMGFDCVPLPRISIMSSSLLGNVIPLIRVSSLISGFLFDFFHSSRKFLSN